MGLEVFLRRLKDIFDSQDFAAAESPVGTGPRILDASDVRNLDVPHLFLAGLSEASFPRSRQDDCLYTEAERRRMSAREVRGGPFVAAAGRNAAVLLDRDAGPPEPDAQLSERQRRWPAAVLQSVRGGIAHPLRAGNAARDGRTATSTPSLPASGR